MGNHNSSSMAGERRHKDSSGSGPVLPHKHDGPPMINDRAKILKTQTSEDDHEPRSPEPREEPLKYRPDASRKWLPCVIKWTGGGQNVSLAGSFNKWNKIRMVKSEKDFVAIVNLCKGEFEYKFEVDGEWKVNQQEETVTNQSGHENNVISIDDSHFAELENELLNDPNDDATGIDWASGGGGTRQEAEKDEGYAQVVPEYKASDRIRDPPVLPPHLLQVILNKDTPVSCEPTLLPEPNHVIVNHMYALSIRDGMMVLSTTHRFKKKSVTTLIYRPM